MAQVDNIIGYVKGPQGDAASISVGNVSTGAAGSSASVTNRGTSSAAVLDFTIPKGEKGDAGTPGVSSYASASEAGLVRVGDDVIVNSSNGILSLNSNNITEPSEVTNLVSGDSYRTILGKIKKFISTFSSNNFLINALTSSATDKALTANMGRALANNIATIETSSTASRAYSIGEHLIYGGQLYTVTAAIVSGGTLTVGTNIEASKLADELTSSISAHSGDIATIETTNTASRNYTVGKLIMLGNQLYRTTAAIATGATLEVGTNIEVTNLGDQISSLNDSLNNRPLFPTSLIRTQTLATYTLSDTTKHTTSVAIPHDGWLALTFTSSGATLDLVTRYRVNTAYGNFRRCAYPAYYGNEPIDGLFVKQGDSFSVVYQKISGADDASIALVLLY